MVFNKGFLQSTALGVVFSLSFSSFVDAVPVIDDMEDELSLTSPSKKVKLESEENSLVTGKSEYKESQDDWIESLFLDDLFDPMAEMVPSAQPSQDPSLFVLGELFTHEDHRNVKQSLWSFLTLQDLIRWRLVNKKMRDDVDSYLKLTDKRRLADKVWQDGPEKDSLDNYRLNAALFYVYKHIIISNETKILYDTYNKDPNHPLNKSPKELLKQSLELAEPIIKVQAYLNKCFAHYPALIERISDFLTSVYNYLTDPNSEFVIDDIHKGIKFFSDDQVYSGHQELMRLYFYLTLEGYNPTEGYYADLEDDISKMGLVKRHFLVEQKKKEGLTSYKFDLTQSVPRLIAISHDEAYWDFIIRHGIYFTENVFIYAVRDTNDLTRKLILWDELFKQIPNAPSYCYERAARNFFDAKNYGRAVELGEKAFQKNPNIDFSSIDLVGDCYIKRGDLSGAADFWDRVLRLRTKPRVSRMAFISHYNAELYARAADIWDKLFEEQYLELKRNNIKYDDKEQLFKKAVLSHMLAGNLSRASELVQKYVDQREEENKATLEDYDMALEILKIAGNTTAFESLVKKLNKKRN